MNVFKTFLLLSLLSVLLTSTAFGTKYYSVNGQYPHLLTSWNTQPGGGGTSPLNFTSADTFVVQNGHTISTNGSWNLTGANSELQVFGILNINATSVVTVQQLTIFASGTVNISPGNQLTVNNGNASGYDLKVFGVLSNAGVMTFNGGAAGQVSGDYYHQIDGGTIPLLNWDINSVCHIAGIVNSTSLSGLNQQFYHLYYNSGSQVSVMNFSGQLSFVAGTFSINSTGSGSVVLFNSNSKVNVGYFEQLGGNLNFSNVGGVTDTIFVNGSFDQYAGSVQMSGAGGKGIFFLNSTGTFSSAGTIGANISYTVSINGNYTLGSNLFVPVGNDLQVNGVLDFGSYAIIGSGNFSNSPSSSLGICDPNGITQSGALGNVQVTGARIYNTSAEYEYHGTTPQSIGDGLPSFVGSLKINNMYGVTLSKSITVTNDLHLVSGQFSIGADTLTLENLWDTSTGFLNASSGTVIYGKPSDGQDIINGNYKNLIFNNFGKNLQTGTIGVSELFIPGTSSSHVVNYGNTIDFNGSGGQTIPAFTYQNLTISGYRAAIVTLDNSNTIVISGVFNPSIIFASGGLITAGTTLEFNGGNGQTIPVLFGGVPYNNVVMNKNDGGLNAGGAITLTGDLTLTQGNLYDNGYVVTVNGNIFGAGGYHTTTGGKILLSGGSAQHQIGNVVIEKLEIDDVVYGAGNVATPSIKDLLLTNGSYDPGSGVTILDGGSISKSSGDFGSSPNIYFNGAGTVTGTFYFSSVQVNGTVDLGAGSSISGTLQINPGGSIVGYAPDYGEGALLKYYSGGIFLRGLEWSATSGAGYPEHVQISNNTIVDLGANSGSTILRQIAGNLTIDAGSILTMNSDGSEMIEPLIVLGSLENYGTLELSSQSGGYLQLNGNLLQDGVLTSNTSAVRLAGSSPQLINKTGGGTIYFDSLIIASSDSVVMRTVNNANLNVAKAFVMQSGIFNAEWSMLSLGNGATFEYIGGNFVVSTGSNVYFNGNGSIIGSIALYNVYTAGMLDPGTGLTVESMLRLDMGGSIVNNAPTYGPSSQLNYNVFGTFTPGIEWSSVSGAGFPNDVMVDNATTLDLGGNGRSAEAYEIARILFIQGGSALTMNGDGHEMTNTLTIHGDVHIVGTLTLSSVNGGDIRVGGTWFKSGAFDPQNGEVEFIGAGVIINDATTFNDLTINNGNDFVYTNADVTVNGVLNFQNGSINTNSNKVSLATTGSSTRTTGHVVGNLEAPFPLGSETYEFPVGDMSNYLPVRISANNVTNAGTITVSTSTSGQDLTGSNIDPGKKVNRFWTVSNSGTVFDNYELTLNFNEADIDAGANTNAFVVKRYGGEVWNSTASGTHTPTSTQAIGLTDFGEFAVGEQMSNDIVASAGPGGSIDPSGTTSVPYDGSQSFTITPDAGYSVDHVDVDAVDQGPITSYDFTNVTSSHTIEAYFTTQICTLSVNVFGNGIASPGMAQIPFGTDQQFIFTPDPGYHIDSVLVDYIKTDSLNSYTFIGTTSSHSITAYFSQNYAVTFSVDMRPAIQWGRFVPATDSLVLRGSIVPLQWGGAAYRLSDPNNDSIYTLTAELNHIDTLYYKYVILHKGFEMWERETPVNQNRLVVLTGTETLPVESFDGLGEYAALTGEYTVDLNTNILLHLNEDPATGPTNYTGHGFPAFDLSLKGNHGYKNINTAVTGRFGSAMPLDGVDDYINFIEDPSIETQDITLEGWFSFGAANNGKVLLSKTVGSGMANSYIIYYDNGELTGGIGTSSGMGPMLSASWTPTFGQWYHIAYTFDNVLDNHTLYVNGVPIATGTNSTSIEYDPHPILVGAEIENEILSNYFVGAVDEVRISSVSRTPSTFNVQLRPNLFSATPSENAVSLSWSNGGGAAPFMRYRIYRGADSTSMTQIDSSLSISFSDNALSYGTYFYRIASVDSTGFEGEKSFALTALVQDITPPAAPQNLMSAAGDGAVTLHWNPNAEADLSKYYIYGGTAIYPTTVIDSAYGGLNDTLKIITGLTNYQQYFFRITAADINGNISGYSDQRGALPTDTTKPEIPKNLVAVAGDSLITIHWNPISNGDFSKYYIYLSLLGNSTVVYDSLTSVNDTIKVLRGLNNYTNYYVRITAVDTNGNISDYSNEPLAMPSDLTAPSVPTALVVTDSVASYFTIAWNMNTESDIAKYYIYRDSVPNVTTLVDSTGNVADTSRAFTNLTIGQPYYFRVAAVDTSFNISPLSNEVTAVPYMIYTIGSFAYGNGTISPTGSNFVNHGDSITFTIHADIHNHIDSIAIDPNIVIMVEQRPISGFDAHEMKKRTKRRAAIEQIMDPITFFGAGNDDTLQTYTFTNVLSGHSIKAYFSINTFQITASAFGNGTISPDGPTLVNYGDMIKYSITPDQYHHIDSVVVDGVRTDSTVEYTFENVVSPHTIEAYFSPNLLHHFIIVNSDRNQLFQQTAGQSFTMYTVAVDSFGNPVNTFTGSVWFSSSDSTMNVFGGNYSIPFIGGEHGPQLITMYNAGSHTISVIDSVSGRKGITDPFTVNPAGLHHFAVVDTSGSAVPQQVKSAPFPIKIIAQDIYNNVQSDYSNVVEVSVSDGASTILTAGTTPNFVNGVLCSYTMQIDTTGYYKITVGDNLAERGGHSNFFTVVPQTNPIFSTSMNGVISPLGSVPVNYGESAIFTFAPYAHYHFDSLHVDGIRVFDSTSQYTFFNVINSHSIDVFNSVNLNIAPMFTSVLSDTAIARFDTLFFQYHAFDPDSGKINYSLVNAPSGASIDSTGLLKFIPALNANGTHSIIIQMKDDSLAFVDDTVLVRVNVYGDVSGNGTISSFDASLVLQNSVSALPFSPLQERVGDVSGNGSISSMDASYLLQYAVGMISSFPGGLGKQQKSEAVLSAFSFRIQKSTEADEYDLYISVNKPSHVLGISMSLEFDSTIVAPKVFSKSVMTDSMSMASKFFGEEVKVAMAGIHPLDKAGEIFKFTFVLKDKNYSRNAVLFTMKKFLLNETDFTNDIGGITLNVRDLAQLPTVYRLEQNFPNPFNPTTTINYQLPEASSVKITIYNILGQEVKTLINEQQETGYYSLQWYGTDNTNRMTASGMYVYRIEAVGAGNKHFTQVKKMMLIK